MYEEMGKRVQGAKDQGGTIKQISIMGKEY